MVVRCVTVLMHAWKKLLFYMPDPFRSIIASGYATFEKPAELHDEIKTTVEDRHRCRFRRPGKQDRVPGAGEDACPQARRFAPATTNA